MCPSAPTYAANLVGRSRYYHCHWTVLSPLSTDVSDHHLLQLNPRNDIYIYEFWAVGVGVGVKKGKRGRGWGGILGRGRALNPKGRGPRPGPPVLPHIGRLLQSSMSNYDEKSLNIRIIFVSHLQMVFLAHRDGCCMCRAWEKNSAKTDKNPLLF